MQKETGGRLTPPPPEIIKADDCPVKLTRNVQKHKTQPPPSEKNLTENTPTPNQRQRENLYHMIKNRARGYREIRRKRQKSTAKIRLIFY
ncbi:hypothetical protein FACS1894216_17400 [Synergistales bacterium]|nr:hypothetical protein FACS1894216_17400 [Synergistales bacterium]